MRILKNILLGIVGFVALLLIVAIFVPIKYIVSVTETINRPQQEVFDYIKILDNQKEYSVWVLADPELKPEIIGQDGTIGAIQKWNSKIDDVGEGEQEITSLSPNRIDVDLRFKRPFEGKAKASNILKAITENQTEVTAEFYGDEAYPFNLMFYLFGRKMIADSERQNLQNIKKILESK